MDKTFAPFYILLMLIGAIGMSSMENWQAGLALLLHAGFLLLYFKER